MTISTIHSNMKKILSLFLSLLLIPCIAYAEYRMNPMTGKLDYYEKSYGLDTEVLFKDGTVVTGDSNFTYNKATKLLTAGGYSSTLPSGSVGYVHLKEDPANGTEYVGFKSPSALAANLEFEMPSVDGGAGEFLKTNGSKVLSWGSASGTSYATYISDDAVSKINSASGNMSVNFGSGLSVATTGQTATITAISTDAAISKVTVDTVLRIPNGAAPSLSSVGQIAITTALTSDSEIQYFGDLSRAIGTYQSKSIVIVSPDDLADYAFWKVPYDLTIREIYLLCQNGTSVAGQLLECNSNGLACTAVDGAITANNGTTAKDDGSLTNPDIAKGNWVSWDTTASSGIVSAEAITFYFTKNPIT